MEVNVRLLMSDKITCELLHHQRASFYRRASPASLHVNSLRRRISSGVAVSDRLQSSAHELSGNPRLCVVVLGEFWKSANPAGKVGNVSSNCTPSRFRTKL
ncbi:hypothetical protein EVAR_96659_1 [Eumeta japonica]|uniref:Uncharacterized protein n=1 Tax=Eumeta variegata TaxID=151549 RepID=A0A4C1STB1_EUMVA|nr:hypothetical protein EVAR_96659_1 [Eumeta japonica]